MKKKQSLRLTFKSTIFLMALLLVFTFSFGGVAHAEQAQANAKLPVEQKFIVKNANPNSVNLKGVYELTAFDSKNPMPEGSAEGTYTFTLDGNESKEISIAYTHGGEYKYSIRQTTKDAGRYTYDRRVYTVTVYVINGQNGELTPQIIVENEQKEKCGKILFENTYTGKPAPGIFPPEVNPPGIDPPEVIPPDIYPPGITPPGIKPPGIYPPGSQMPGITPPGIQLPENYPPQNPALNGSSEAVTTGDNNSLAVWITMLVLASVAIAVVVILKKKAENKKEK